MLIDEASFGTGRINYVRAIVVEYSIFVCGHGFHSVVLRKAKKKLFKLDVFFVFFCGLVGAEWMIELNIVYGLRINWFGFHFDLVIGIEVIGGLYL